MVVAEPSSEFGLWPRVKALSGWPESNEDTIALLAEDWRASSGHFAGVAGHRVNAASWTDSGGQGFTARVGGHMGEASDVAAGMAGLAGRAAGFATEVAQVKTDIRGLVETNLPAYAAASLLPAGVAGPVQENFVNQLAGAVNDRIALAASTVAGGKPWPPPPPGVPSWGEPSGPPPDKGRAATQEELRSWIDQARQILIARGVDPALMDPNQLAVLIRHESSGNPHAINLWDSNADKGTPSKGLMQTIDPTFEAHKLPEHPNIYNPVDNIIAGTRYAIDRYGSISNVPGIRKLESGGEYEGY